MSSTSSSECMCPECFVNYGANDGNFRLRKPLYQTLGHPLIYYTFKKQQSYKKCKVSKRGSSNCFAKAFRWYTEERLPPQSKHTRRECAEFASWLDVKYDEFLQQKQIGDSWRNCFEETTPRETKRDTCPWGKKHRSRKCDCTIEKRLQSLEFIMEPKELNGPASEDKQQLTQNKPTDISAVSSELEIYKKTIIKTHNSEKNLGTCGSSNCVKDVKNNKESEIQIMPKLVQKKIKTFNNIEKSRKQTPLSLRNDISCQCSNITVTTVSTPTQYQDADCSCYADNRSIDCNLNSLIRERMPPLKHLRDLTPLAEGHVIYQNKPKCTQLPPKTSNTETSPIVDDKSHLAKVSTYDNSLQTSDNSIDLVGDGVQKYPLFMKIIYADRLKEERTGF